MSRQILHSKLVELLEAASPSWLEDDFGLLKSFSEPLEFELVAIFIVITCYCRNPKELNRNSRIDSFHPRSWAKVQIIPEFLGIPCKKWPPCYEGFLVRNTVGYLKIEICFSFHKHNIDELFLLLGLARNKNSLRKSKITPCLTTVRFAYSKLKCISAAVLYVLKYYFENIILNWLVQFGKLIINCLVFKLYCKFIKMFQKDFLSLWI